MIGCFVGLILVILIDVNQWTTPGSITFMILLLVMLILLIVILKIHYNKATKFRDNLLSFNTSEQDSKNTKWA